MARRRNTFGSLLETNNHSHHQQQQSRIYSHDPNIDLVTQNDTLQSILPEFIKVVRKLLPQELPFDMYVHDVEYLEGGCKRLTGNLYLSNFRLVFAPDNNTDDRILISLGNKYIGEYDIPLASIYKIHVAPVNARQGFKSFLNENQIQLETRTFTITTKDFRSITFTKCSVTNSNTREKKHVEVSVTKMEKYIEALKANSCCQDQRQLYLYTALQEYPMGRTVSQNNRSDLVSSPRYAEHDIEEFDSNKDERIRSYMTYNDWRDELYEANEQQWIVDRKKFDNQSTINADGPYVRFVYSNNCDGSGNLIWHWTHTVQTSNKSYHQRQLQPSKHMLITVPGIVETTGNVEPMEPIISSQITPLPSPFRFPKIKKKNLFKPLRRNTVDDSKLLFPIDSKITVDDFKDLPPDSGLRRITTDTNLIGSSNFIDNQSFESYNISKFPCNLKRLQTSYEKLIELCLITSNDDDDKWLTKLQSCKWLKYISKALHGAASLAKLLDFTNIQLVGSDTDNSCLMSSLIQILLRPKCRTIKGFCELIVREWIVRGHRFIERFGQILYDRNGSPVQEAPVFLLFLDCVHQLIVQNPFSFEFTDYLLIQLYRNVCYAYHHTFVFNDIVERFYMLDHYPKHLLVLSSFDFSLYLNIDACLLLKNPSSIFNSQSSVLSSTSPQKKQSRIEATVVYPSSPSLRCPNRSVYHIETARSANFSVDVPISNNILMLNLKQQYDYETIESPQQFPLDLYVDWRAFNLVLWSKCYCRYDQNYMPTLLERQLLFEINCMKEDISNLQAKPRHIILDTLENVDHANSWHPQMLVTRV